MRRLILAAFLVAAGCEDSADKGTDDTNDTDDTDGGGELTRAETIAALSGDAARGDTLFDDNLCGTCHMDDGTGLGNDITDPSEFSQDDVISILLEGEGIMASYAVLADQDLADITAFVLSGIAD